MKKFLMAAGAAALAMTAQVASAATFNFSFSGTTTETQATVSGKGVLSIADDDAGTVSNGSTFFEITGLTGTVDLPGFSNVEILGPATLGSGSDETVNFIKLTNGIYSLAQLGFTFPASAPANFALFTGNEANLVVNGGDLTIADTNFAISAIPEPATWTLMIVGFGMVGATVRRRRVTFADA